MIEGYGRMEDGECSSDVLEVGWGPIVENVESPTTFATMHRECRMSGYCYARSYVVGFGNVSAMLAA